MKTTDTAIQRSNEYSANDLNAHWASHALASISPQTKDVMRRMFADPRLLEKQERAELVSELRQCVRQHPKVSELRVLYGMALCVNLSVQEAMEEFAEGVSLDPDSYIAHLKMGELWMRLRVCEKAMDHTSYASRLAENLAQSEMARRQAAALRIMMREGIQRGNYGRKSWFSLGRLRRLWSRNRGEAEALATADVQ